MVRRELVVFAYGLCWTLVEMGFHSTTDVCFLSLYFFQMEMEYVLIFFAVLLTRQCFTLCLVFCIIDLDCDTNSFDGWIISMAPTLLKYQTHCLFGGPIGSPASLVKLEPVHDQHVVKKYLLPSLWSLMVNTMVIRLSVWWWGIVGKHFSSNCK